MFDLEKYIDKKKEELTIIDIMIDKLDSLSLNNLVSITV